MEKEQYKLLTKDEFMKRFVDEANDYVFVKKTPGCEVFNTDKGWFDSIDDVCGYDETLKTLVDFLYDDYVRKFTFAEELKNVLEEICDGN